VSRSGYSEDVSDLEAGRWRAAVNRALKGRRGQEFLRALREALDAMPDKKLYPGSFATADGEYCTLGVLGAQRGIRMDDLGDESWCDTELVGDRFGIATSLAAEVMYLNDEYLADTHKWVEVEICGPMPPYSLVRGHQQHKRFVSVPNPNHPEERWKKVREWVEENIMEKA